MATKIRLKRGGRKGKPFYRIVVQDSRVRSKGRDLDTLGFYHPAALPEPVSEVNVHKTLDWLAKGAQLSDTARSIMSKTGVLKHYHDGTRPEATTASITGGVVENKGYNAPPPPREKEEPVVEAQDTAVPEEADAAEPVAEPVAEPAAEETGTEQA
ncbi:MAG: 30S ribosomal protein S16 [Candidatus Hydrogenedentes bacterium]|nr:30S ribosomal protein S16 [Candidatus Hydrogenedentota bacterium]